MSLSRKLTAFTLSGLFVACLTTQALASETLFNTLDVDQSGSISKTEANAHSDLTKIFSEVDANGDGEISYDEFTAAGLDE
ncbi:EF-hand domain-containing protein [Glaciecola sp. XM2]|jgi:Ca2+-binding EF-hand superfamily protein|uniref:EF-hand domain-containing protein n=1 Tax=Glaciecola sp. XM2 TaxID=1914931 RepID=UPI001BDE9820|nr:EF-hand domain-containing protein [Glaciecola sp. XM2]MBT1449989.1 EF-hand domain-containing protein [Glaciecola sp. XM2]